MFPGFVPKIPLADTPKTPKMSHPPPEYTRKPPGFTEKTPTKPICTNKSTLFY